MLFKNFEGIYTKMKSLWHLVEKNRVFFYSKDVWQDKLMMNFIRKLFIKKRAVQEPLSPWKQKSSFRRGFWVR